MICITKRRYYEASTYGARPTLKESLSVRAESLVAEQGVFELRGTLILDLLSDASYVKLPDTCTVCFSLKRILNLDQL